MEFTRVFWNVWFKPASRWAGVCMRGACWATITICASRLRSRIWWKGCAGCSRSGSCRTNRFNHFRKSNGHVFQGRYQAILLDGDAVAMSFPVRRRDWRRIATESGRLRSSCPVRRRDWRRIATESGRVAKLMSGAETRLASHRYRIRTGIKAWHDRQLPDLSISG